MRTVRCNERVLAQLLNKLYPQFGPFKETDRQDLVAVLGTGLKSPNLNYTGPTFADEIRLNLSIAPTAPVGEGNRLGVIGGDLAGYPNGRRLEDDVVDISERVVGGALIGHSLPLGHGVSGSPEPRYRVDGSHPPRAAGANWGVISDSRPGSRISST